MPRQLHFASGDRFRLWRVVKGVLLVVLAVLGVGLGMVEMLWAVGAGPTTAPVLPTLEEVVAKLDRFSLSGRVIDKEGKPVAGADVFLCYTRMDCGLRDRLAGQVKSAEDGSFRFEKAIVWEPERPGRTRYDHDRYYVTARHPDHGLEFATVFQKDPTEGVVVRLQGRQDWRVMAVDTQGNPVVGARVFLTSGFHGAGIEKQFDGDHRFLTICRDFGISSGLTNAKGEVILMGPPQEATFRIEKDGYAYNSGRDKVTLHPGAKVSGRVTYPDGTAASGVVVWFTYHGDRLAALDFTFTDGQGRYEFRNTPASGYRFGFMPDDAERNVKGVASIKAEDLRPNSPYLGKGIWFPIQPGEVYAKDLSLSKPIILAGKVIDVATNQLAPQVQVRAYASIEGVNFLDPIPVKVDGDGNFRTSVVPGTRLGFQTDRSSQDDYVVDEDWRRQEGNWQGIPDQEYTTDRTDLVFRVKLRPVGRLTGKVVDEKDRPVPGARIHMHPDVPPVKSDAAGAFVLKVAPKDRDFDLCAITDDKSLGGVVRLKAGATEATIKVEPTADYDGVVTNTEGLPAANLSFYVDLRLNGQALYNVREEPKTDLAGKFKIQHLIPHATYKAWWISDDQTNRDYDYSGDLLIEPAKLKPGEPIAFQTKQFLNTLIGRVVNEKGEPIAGATIDTGLSDLLPQDLRFNLRQIAVDKKGEFTIRRLAAGMIRLRVRAPGYKAGSYRVPTDSIDFKAVLRPATEPCRYEATVVDEEGKPLQGVPVVLWEQSRDERGKVDVRSRTLQTDGDGKARAELPSLTEKQARTVFLYCDLEGRNLAFYRVAENEDVDVRLVAAKSSRGWQGRVVDSAGKPIANAMIHVTSYTPDRSDPSSQVFLMELQGRAEAFKLSTTSDQDGRFQLSRMGQAWTTIRISLPGYSSLDSRFDPAEDNNKGEKAFVLSPGASVKGRVVLKSTGQPPKEKGNGEICLDGPNGSNMSKIKGDWTFALNELVTGSYRTRFYPSGADICKYVCPMPPSFTAVMGTTAEIILEVEEGIPVRGKLVHAKTNQPVEGIVELRLKGGDRGSIGVQADRDGSWLVYLPQEGEYVVSCYPNPTRQPKEIKTITVQKSRPMAELLIQVDPDAK
ncbi:MAG: carboxypeptidase regulatory-like domain-containing protein [Bacillota bacterium]